MGRTASIGSTGRKGSLFATARPGAEQSDTRTPILIEAKVNARWSLDFVHDQLAKGRRFCTLNIVDDVRGECFAAIPDTSISGKRVARELTTITTVRGKPQMIVSDNRSEFTLNAVLSWAKDHGIDWHYVAPSRPMQNGYIEPFNGRMRDELLNESSVHRSRSDSPTHPRLDHRLQRREAALLARLQTAYGLCRYTRRAA